MMKSNICIIGAGAAGLMAGIFATHSQAQVIIFDSNTVAGRKLLRTGRGRCNLTHTGSIDDFIKIYARSGRFLKHSLHEFSPEEVRAYFAKHGLATKEEKNGCVFPITDRAADVKRLLEDVARRAGVKFAYGREVNSIERQGGSFVVSRGDERIFADSVIIATGGVSWPFTGSTGQGYEFAQTFGHSIITPKAALVPLVSKQDWPGKLQGVAIEKVCITASMGEKKVKTTGALMFTGYGVGGPATFDLSRLITSYLADSHRPVEISIDIMPELTIQELDKLIVRKCSEHPKKELAGLLTRFLPRASAIYLCNRLQTAKPILAGQLTRPRRSELVELIKNLPLTIVSTRPIAEATITSGGVCTDEIDSKTMGSKLCKGLFFAGEVIDVDGPCGGYNLQIAWSTGALAGKNAIT